MCFFTVSNKSYHYLQKVPKWLEFNSENILKLLLKYIKVHDFGTLQKVTHVVSYILLKSALFCIKKLFGQINRFFGPFLGVQHSLLRTVYILSTSSSPMFLTYECHFIKFLFFFSRYVPFLLSFTRQKTLPHITCHISWIWA